MALPPSEPLFFRLSDAKAKVYPMDFELLERGGGTYGLRGDLTFATASGALKATAGLFGKGTEYRFDLAEICRADSAGVALLLEWQRRAAQRGAKILYLRIPRHLRAIAEVSGVAALLSAGAPDLLQ